MPPHRERVVRGSVVSEHLIHLFNEPRSLVDTVTTHLYEGWRRGDRLLVAEQAATLMRDQEQYGAWIHEAHHATKRDAPSGTAILLRDAMAQAGFNRPIDMSSTRAGTIPGTHTIGFDSASDTIELTHTARDRRGFATGALLAARWIQGKQGWYSMQDVLKG